jgi:hypothetical protein
MIDLHPKAKGFTAAKVVEHPLAKFHINAMGQLHRDDGPAVESKNGDLEWIVNGKFHRDMGEGPARLLNNGTRREYFENGVLKGIEDDTINGGKWHDAGTGEWIDRNLGSGSNS